MPMITGPVTSQLPTLLFFLARNAIVLINTIQSVVSCQRGTKRKAFSSTRAYLAFSNPARTKR